MKLKQIKTNNKGPQKYAMYMCFWLNQTESIMTTFRRVVVWIIPVTLLINRMIYLSIAAPDSLEFTYL